jgi:hypothetical protein
MVADSSFVAQSPRMASSVVFIGIIAGTGTIWLAQRMSGLGGNIMWIPALLTTGVGNIVCLPLAVYLDWSGTAGGELSLGSAATGCLFGAYLRIKADEW